MENSSMKSFNTSRRPLRLPGFSLLMSNILIVLTHASLSMAIGTGITPNSACKAFEKQVLIKMLTTTGDSSISRVKNGVVFPKVLQEHVLKVEALRSVPSEGPPPSIPCSLKIEDFLATNFVQHSALNRFQLPVILCDFQVAFNVVLLLVSPCVAAISAGVRFGGLQVFGDEDSSKLQRLPLVPGFTASEGVPVDVTHLRI
uniref:Uncharacterized protein n=1 Tax=Glossina brevipalpis TaxID=37001 RepID=A0A1A9WEN0_9MUSC